MLDNPKRKSGDFRYFFNFPLLHARLEGHIENKQLFNDFLNPIDDYVFDISNFVR